MKRLGTLNEQGQTQVKFGYLFDETANTFEALSGTLTTARKLKVQHYIIIYMLFYSSQLFKEL